MKYKDLNIGDYFLLSLNGKKYIKTSNSSHGSIGISLENDDFGMGSAYVADDSDVKFISKIHYISPRQKVDSPSTLGSAPYGCLLKFNNSYVVKIVSETPYVADILLINSSICQGERASSKTITSMSCELIAEAHLKYIEQPLICS